MAEASFELIRDEDGKKKTLKFPDLSTFQWSPKDRTWISRVPWWFHGMPVTLVEAVPLFRAKAVASGQLAERLVFGAGEQPCQVGLGGDPFAERIGVQVEDAGATNLEIFRIREKNIPVDIVEAG
eukprot:Skav231152  [mRNA]  locus=scaffold1736:10352:12591:- [translate_table: standard]